MTTNEAVQLVRSLCQRFDAEPRRFGSYISDLERQALGLLLKAWDASDVGVSGPSELPVPQASSGQDQGPPAESPAIGSAPAVVVVRYKPCLDALDRTGPESPNFLLCLDFGTAKSKACASRREFDDEEEADLIELALGTLDGDIDQSTYPVSSSVWIDEDEKVYVGAEAVRRGQHRSVQGSRRRIDSLKQYISQAHSEEDLTFGVLSADENPTTVRLSMDDIVVFYLGYLTDLALKAAGDHGISRYVSRRFTLPCWDAGHRKWSTHYLSRRIARAQVVADSFRNRWTEGIPAQEVHEIIRRTSEEEERLLYLLDTVQNCPPDLSRYWAGVLEPLAAGSARLLSAEDRREMVLVVDVGAGTTDFSLFMTYQQADRSRGVVNRGAVPLEPVGAAVRVAGNHLDDLLCEEFIRQAGLAGDARLRDYAKARIERAGVRRLKEELFETGQTRFRMGNDIVVSVARDQFLEIEGVRRFSDQLHENLKVFLAQVDRSWTTQMERVTLVLTGGGCDLPMVRQIATKAWMTHGTVVRFDLAEREPALIRESFKAEFVREYPQLAVAIGGCLPVILDERHAQRCRLGDFIPPGPLTRYRVSGT